MGLAGLLMRLQRFKQYKGRRGCKRDDSTFDSNELYDIVSLMETEGGDVEQSLVSNFEDQHESIECLEVGLPSTWTPLTPNELFDEGSAIAKPNETTEVEKLLAADTSSLINLGIVKVEPESVHDCYEVQRARETLGADDAATDVPESPRPRHPIAEIAVSMSLCNDRSESLDADIVEVAETSSAEEATPIYIFEDDDDNEDDGMIIGMTKDETRKMYLLDLKEISQVHIAEVKGDCYVPGAILGDDCSITVISKSTEKDDAFVELSNIQGFVLDFMQEATNVVSCGLNTPTLVPLTDKEKVARAVQERERSIDVIVSELAASETPKVVEAAKQYTMNQQRFDYEWERNRRRRAMDDDSTISTRMSMHLDIDNSY